MRILAMYFLVLGLLTSACQQEPGQDLGKPHTKDKHIYVRLPITDLTQEFTKRTGFIRDHKHDSAFAFGYLDRSKLDELTAQESDSVVQLDDRYQHQEFDAKSLVLDTNNGVEIFATAEGYHNYEQLTTEMQSLAAAHPDLAVLNSAGKSVEGRDLWYMKISDNAATDEAEPKLLYIANMHGDETVGREMMVYLIRKLLNEYATNPRVKNLVDNSQIYIMPSMNPDGFEAHTRFNADGVDLNRNFPDFSSDPTDTQDGRAVETQAIMRLNDQNHFDLAINYHGGDICFNIPWDTIANSDATKKFGDDSLISAYGREYTHANSDMYANTEFDHGLTYGYEWYEVDGGMQDWSSYYRGQVHATVELGPKWPGADTLPSYWQQNGEAMFKYLERGLEGAHLEVVDDSGQPVNNVTVSLGTSHRSLKFDTNLIHRVALSGAQTLGLEADGYAPVSTNITAGPFTGEMTKITMHKTNGRAAYLR